MTWIIFLLIGLVVGFASGIWLAGSKGNMDAAREAVQRRKAQDKEKVLQLFDQKTEITNDDVQGLLSVSDATATNFLSELEAEGKITQIGLTGRPVHYEKNG